MSQEIVKLMAVGTLTLIIAICIILVMVKRRRRPCTVSIKKGSDVPFRPSEAGKHLADFLSASFNIAEGAESRVERALEHLRRNPEAAIVEIDFAFRALPEQSYNARWALVYTAVKLEHPVSLDFLKYVATLPIPPERSKDLCHHSTVGEETMIRTRAVRGLKVLALAGDKQARSVLLELLKLNPLSIKAEAAQALLQLPERDQLEPQIRRELGEKYSFILNIREVKPEEFNSVFGPRMKEPGTIKITMAKPRKIAPDELGSQVPPRPISGKGAPRASK